MSDQMLLEPVELTLEELDAVCGGAASLVEVKNIQVTVQDINLGVNANVLGTAAQGNFQRT